MEPQNPIQGMSQPNPMMPPQQMASPEQKQQLEQMISAIRGNLSKMQTVKFSESKKNDVIRDQAIQKVFSILEMAGVDLNDPASVAAFIDKVRGKNPELAQDLEDILMSFFGEEADLEMQQPEMAEPQMEQPMPQGLPPQMGDLGQLQERG